MAWNVNDVIRLVLRWRDSRTQSIYVNSHLYRVSVGSVPDETTVLNQLSASFYTVVQARLFDVMLSNVAIETFTAQKVNSPIGIAYDLSVGEAQWTNNSGNLTAAASDPAPQLSWHFTRKSFVPGRKGIGHLYVPGGTLAFLQAGGLIVTTGTPADDLQAACDALGDPITAGGLTLKPCVIGFQPVTPPLKGTVLGAYDAKNDVRKVVFSKQPTFHRSRRAGVGQ